MRRFLFLFLLSVAVLPARADERVTVEKLEQTLAAVHTKRDQDLAKQLGSMELSERLSTPRLAKIQAGLPGGKSRAALLVLADASAFLPLPASEIPAVPPPDTHTQNLIVSRAAEDLTASVHKLPDFFARQTTSRFHDLKVSYVSRASEPVIVEGQPFRPLDSFSDTVYYRNGQEVEESSEIRSGIKLRPRNGLMNWGTFGQLQRIVVTDIYKGTMEWGHWEQRATGPVAVFQYSIPKDKSNYVVNYCCLGLPNEAWHDFQSIPAFHGEIAIDPANGAVYRLVLITDLEPSDPILQAEIMVEYEPAEIGGKMYICPRKSVTITTAIAPIVGPGGCAGRAIQTDCLPPRVYRPRDTAINDTVYDSYHVFRSEVRMLPPGTEDPEGIPPPDKPAPTPSATPPSISPQKQESAARAR